MAAPCVPPASATASVSPAAVTPPRINHAFDGEVTFGGGARIHARLTAGADMLATRANSSTHARASRFAMSTNGATVMTTPIAGRANRRHLDAEPPAQAKTTASAANAPTLIFTRHRAATITPMATALARGLVDRKSTRL